MCRKQGGKRLYVVVAYVSDREVDRRTVWAWNRREAYLAVSRELVTHEKWDAWRKAVKRPVVGKKGGQ